jgi:predicted esterase
VVFHLAALDMADLLDGLKSKDSARHHAPEKRGARVSRRAGGAPGRIDCAAGPAMLGSAAMRTPGFVLAVVALALWPLLADAKPRLRRAKAASPETPASWCAPEVEALGRDVCHVGGAAKDGPRTLVVFLHGAIAKNTTWQWTQQRALARQAKHGGFEAIFPRAPLGERGYLWPGSVKAQAEHEQQLVDGWAAARRRLEARNGRPFDHVFVMGFSSGAYFVSSLALRGRLDVDGYAAFAGGAAAHGPKAPEPHHPPVFVGVCADDKQTAAHSRAFGAALAARGIPHRVDEKRVGHAFSDGHVLRAVGYLRAAAAARTGSAKR